MDEKIKRRGPGQPVKKVPRGKKRIQVSMILSAEIKTRIDNEAKRTGRTFSQTGEMLVERALAVENVLQQTSLTLEELFEAAMLRRGYRKLRVRADPRFPRGFVWVPPEMTKASSRPAKSTLRLGRSPNEGQPDPPRRAVLAPEI